ncbi:RdRP-domain-containing protein [Aaosphaeria arxii CBS 175.79]|uniref:RNA-dependent RNA polymerase n=1 Tax=Aaosphaeria arxii CBS 175.79 TaxID=1450172 RepID=A0A6A5XLZ2_9PLEO|nr:RdRP-domain-containing protein [Aaosphaeria arxii CBS 175.79]KAF2014265.1 RdRP-domain-containing protein [Aaosphaeria arxii CBS 175.79]
MEVYLNKLPPDLTDKSLKEQLAPFIRTLGINTWACEKPHKRPFGFITFLHKHDGQKFLSVHGTRNSSLTLLGGRILCKASDKAPDPFRLKSLEKAVEDEREAQKVPPVAPQAKVIFATRRVTCGYYDYKSGQLTYCPEVQWEASTGFAKFQKRAIVVEFSGQGGKIQIQIPYRIVEALVVSSVKSSLTLTLWEVPSFYKNMDDELEALLAALNVNRAKMGPSRHRLTEIPGGDKSHKEIVGQALVYQFELSPYDFSLMVGRLKARGAIPIYHHNLPICEQHRQRSLAEGLQTLRNAMAKHSTSVPFGLLFQLEALVKNGYLLPWIVQALLERLAKEYNTMAMKHGFVVSSAAIKKLFSQIQFPSVYVDASEFEVDWLYETILANEKEIQGGGGAVLISEKGRQNLTMIHKVNVTPSGITLYGPDPESKNRILRRFSDYTEYFIRAQFCDEDGTDLQFNQKVSNENIYNRFRQVFNKGIQVGGKVFGFLGFSHSSLRSHSAWFMSTFFHQGQLQGYFSVIAHLGKFDNIYSPARCAARIGQAFSETPMAISLSDNGIASFEMNDVRSKDGNRVFSDGVGTISWEVMEAIQAALPNLRHGPTCFQIRWGGAKGMLALDSRLEGACMYLRPSMIKFDSKDTANLEICDTAKRPIPMVLNRQMIKILEDMGVSNEWFLREQSIAVRKLQLITAHIANTVGFLKRLKIADRVGFPQFLRRLDSIKIDYRKDHFLAAVVEAAVLRELRLIKHKARIPICQGVTLFGIMDETGFLNEGEVFITFDPNKYIDGETYNLGERRMIITRSPALHPGDIQLAINTIPPDDSPLHDLRNCIIFSQKGHRDLPSCLSGGDLDGDIYGVIWDRDAVQQCIRVFPPADYPRTEPLNIGRPVEQSDMTDFFIQFMSTDQLGRIAVRHMILADQREAGTDDPDCKLLAEMHSTGVDYSKTGVPVNMDDFRKMKMNKLRPDFLMPAPAATIRHRSEISFDDPSGPGSLDDDEEGSGPVYEYYYSEKINGILYRGIDEKKIWFQDVHQPSQNFTNIWFGLLNYLKRSCMDVACDLPWSQYVQKAWTIRGVYEDAIWGATQEYSDHARMGITELEVFTGEIFNKTGVQTRRQRDKSILLKDEFDRISQSTSAMIRKHDDESAGPTDGLALSIACLDVGIKKPRRNYGREREEGDFQSFKVIAACCAFRELDIVTSMRPGTEEDYVF